MYKGALAKATRAVSYFNEMKVSRVVHLGDIIDGNETEEKTRSDLSAVLETLAPLKAPIDHVIGNHCICIGRDTVLPTLGFDLPRQLCTNRTIDVSPSWRLIILDSLALSVAFAASDKLALDANQYLETHGNDKNATDYNGGLGEEQTAWLREELGRAAEGGVNVVVCAHHPIALGSTGPSLVIWNHEQVMQVLSEYNHTVRACFSGHHHAGGYACESGIHFVVFESILDSQMEAGSYGTVTLHSDRIVIDGQGEMTSRILKF